MLGVDDIRERLAGAGPAILLLVILAGAAAIVLELGAAWRTASHEPRVAALPLRAVDVAARLEEIREADLFGQEAPAHVSLDTDAWPVTHLPLILRGVFTTPTDPERASAIIEGSDGRARMYRVGARLDDETSLRAVHRDRVVLSRAGQIENLYFPDPGQELLASAAGWSAQETQPIPAVEARMTQEGDTRRDVALDAAMSEQERRDVIRRRLEELRARSRAL